MDKNYNEYIEFILTMAELIKEKYKKINYYKYTGEDIRGFLISCEDTKSLRFGGLIGILVRVPISLISIFTPIGIYGFAFGVSIDFMARFIYWKYKANNIVRINAS